MSSIPGPLFLWVTLPSVVSNFLFFKQISEGHKCKLAIRFCEFVTQSFGFVGRTSPHHKAFDLISFQYVTVFSNSNKCTYYFRFGEKKIGIVVWKFSRYWITNLHCYLRLSTDFYITTVLIDSLLVICELFNCCEYKTITSIIWFSSWSQIPNKLKPNNLIKLNNVKFNNLPFINGSHQKFWTLKRTI